MKHTPKSNGDKVYCCIEANSTMGSYTRSRSDNGINTYIVVFKRIVFRVQGNPRVLLWRYLKTGHPYMSCTMWWMALMRIYPLFFSEARTTLCPTRPRPLHHCIQFPSFGDKIFELRFQLEMIYEKYVNF